MTADTHPARKPDQWPDHDALIQWMHDHVDGFQGPATLSKFEGGQSNPTFRVSARSGDYVLRRKPLGQVLPGAHAVDREFRVLTAMASAGVPVPRVYNLCTDDTVIGSMFYVMDMVPGRVFWDPRLPGLSAAERGAIFDSLNATIAQIHSLDPTAIGLSDFGRSENYLQRQVARWSKQNELSKTVENPAMQHLGDWLTRHMPQEHPARIVHGDYRLDNVLIHPTEPRIVAVLDWELSTIGNPIADFAYHMMSWRLAPELFRGLAGVDFGPLGIPLEQDYLSRYLHRTGLARPENWDYYVILGMFRIAAILQGIAKRAQTGSAANADAAHIGAKALPISTLAWDMAKGR